MLSDPQIGLHYRGDAHSRSWYVADPVLLYPTQNAHIAPMKYLVCHGSSMFYSRHCLFCPATSQSSIGSCSMLWRGHICMLVPKLAACDSLKLPSALPEVLCGGTVPGLFVTFTKGQIS